MKPLLSAKNLTKSFGGLVAVNDVSFDIQPGETMGIIGPNGAGKSTLFSVLSGFLRPDKGQILFNGQSIVGVAPHRICKLGLARTFQIMQNFPSISTLENVMIGAFLRHQSISSVRKKAEETLDRVGLAEKCNILARDLTMLDQKRLEIAKVLATDPQLILADETMAGLTPVEINDAVNLIRRLRQENVTFILIEHVMEVIMSLSDNIMVIHHGNKIAEGSPIHVCKDKQVIDAYLGEEYCIV